MQCIRSTCLHHLLFIIKWYCRMSYALWLLMNLDREQRFELQFFLERTNCIYIYNLRLLYVGNYKHNNIIFDFYNSSYV